MAKLAPPEEAVRKFHFILPSRRRAATDFPAPKLKRMSPGLALSLEALYREANAHKVSEVETGTVQDVVEAYGKLVYGSAE